MLARIDEVDKLISTQIDNHQEVYRLLKAQRRAPEAELSELRATTSQLAVQSGLLREIMLCLKQWIAALIDLKRTLAYVATMVAHIHIFIASSHSLYALDPTKGLPAILEDALGRRFSLPAEWLDGLEWEVGIDSVLSSHVLIRHPSDCSRHLITL
jgi:hypothetical protein